MHTTLTAPTSQPEVRAVQVPIEYPESDGEPMADNTKQFWWIVVLAGNLAALFKDCPDVFVGGNIYWFPVEGDPDLRVAPMSLWSSAGPRDSAPLTSSGKRTTFR